MIQATIRLFLLASLVGFLLTACGGFSTTIEVDPPEFENQLVVGVHVEENDSELDFFLGRNSSIFGPEDDEDYFVKNAEITVINESTNQTRDAMESDEELSLYKYVIQQIDSNFFSGGGRYTFKIEHPDYTTSETTLDFPKKEKVENIEFKYEDGLDDEGEETSSVAFDIIDDTSETNYYAVSLISDPFGSVIYGLNTLDPSGSESYDYSELLFSDESFNGTRKRVKIKFDRRYYNPDIDPFPLLLEWHSINKGYYDYSKSLLKHEDSIDNPFSSPLPVSTNVDNSLGIIALSSKSVYEVNP